FIRPGQKLPPRAVVAVVRQLALAMAEAHAKGVIHRDLKPSNIMITPHKQPVIMDFGLARRTGTEDLQLTQTGLLVGTPAYMPPEQLNSDVRAIGPTTDIYALGVILYELLAGRPPFQGPLGELMTRIMTEPPPPLARTRSDLPPALDAICTKALAKKPGDRFASMKEFAAALGDYLHGRYTVPEPEAETYELAVDDTRPLEEQDPAGLFRAMAAKQTRAVRSRPPRRRVRFALPLWLIPLAAGLAILVPAVYGLWEFFQFLERRSQRQDAAAAAAAAARGGILDPAQAAEEERRLAEQKMLEAAVKRLAKHPADATARQEIDAWLDSPAGRRLDLPSAVNFGLGRYLILERDRWEAGVRRLVLAGDGTQWRRAAERDLAAAAADADPAAQVAAGDEWWQLAETLPPANKPRLWGRVKAWYNRALPHLIGAEADRVQKRLAAIDGPRRPA
ncbi:MAG TPA: serine/threonine-protein kinase, partial [Gemmataceae bacterium]